MRARRRWAAALGIALVLVACDTADDDVETTTSPTVAESSATTAVSSPTPTTAAPEETTTTAAPDPALELVVWVDETRAGVLEDVAAEFEAATGVGVAVEIHEFEEIRELVTDLGPDEGPDAFIGAHVWTGELVAAGIVAPVDLGGGVGDFIQVARDGFTSGGTLYALPYATEAVALYYNRDLVPEPPASFEELAEVCAAIDGIENCVGVPGEGDAGDAYHHYLFVSTLGGYIFGYDPVSGYDLTDIGLDSRGAVDGVSFLADQVAAEVLGPVSYTDAKRLFFEGRQPFWITGPWELGNLEDAEVSWGVGVLPTVDGEVSSPLVASQGFFVNARSDRAVIAHAFLLDHIATEETMQALHEADPRGLSYQPLLVELTAGSIPGTFTRSALAGEPIPNIPEMADVWGPLGESLLQVRSGDVSPSQGMATARSAVEAALGE